MSEVLCEYCGRPAVLGQRSQAWPKLIWQCQPCDASVGCHPGTQEPLGTLAKKPLRELRIAAHVAFDPMWKAEGTNKARSIAYKWLSEIMEIDSIHIAKLNEEECTRVILLCGGKLPGEEKAMEVALRAAGVRRRRINESVTALHLYVGNGRSLLVPAGAEYEVIQ